MRVLVVSGTGTGVGKTVVTAALAALARARGERVAVVKPAQTGVGPASRATSRRCAACPASSDLHELARFAEPLAPATAAAGPACRAWRPPTSPRRAAPRGPRPRARRGRRRPARAPRRRAAARSPTSRPMLGAPVLLVVRAGLGTLNETALACEALRARGLACAGVVIGAWPAEPDLAARCNLEDLPAYAGVPVVGRLPGGRRRARARGVPGDGAAAIIELEVTHDGGPRGGPRAGARARRGPAARTQVLAVLELPDDAVDEALELAHEVRMRWCGPEIEVEGIVSLKTGGCPEDCHFCSQSGPLREPGPGRAAGHPLARRGGAPDGDDGRDRVLHRRRRARARRAADGAGARGRRGHPRGGRHQRRLLARDPHARAGRRAARPRRAPLQPQPRDGPLALRQRSSPRTRGRSAGRRSSSSASSAWRSAAAGIIGMGETLAQRAELAAQLAALDPDEVPLNFLDPRPGTPFAHLPPSDAARRAARDRRLPARDAAHRPALRRRPRAHARRPRRPAGRGRRHQRDHRRQLPHDARAATRRTTSTCSRSCRCRSRRCRTPCERRGYCDGCGRPRDEGDHAALPRPPAPRPTRRASARGAARKLARPGAAAPATRRECVRCGLPPR